MSSGRAFTDGAGFCFSWAGLLFSWGIFFFVLSIMLATYFAHKSLASEDAPMKQWGQLLKKRGNGVKIIVYKCHEETQKRLRLPIFGGLTGGCHLKNRHGGVRELVVVQSHISDERLQRSTAETLSRLCVIRLPRALR